MMKITNIRDRKVFEGLEITNEIIRPVAGMWSDGEIRATDHLQLTIRSTTSKPIQSVYAYLNYYDEDGKELGFDVDSPKMPVKPGSEERLSLMLLPPEKWSYATLEVSAEYHSTRKCLLCVFLLSMLIAVILGLQYFIHA